MGRISRNASFVPQINYFLCFDAQCQYEIVVEMDSVTVVTDGVTRNQIDQCLSTSW